MKITVGKLTKEKLLERGTYSAFLRELKSSSIASKDYAWELLNKIDPEIGKEYMNDTRNHGTHIRFSIKKRYDMK
jgi:hypothetical protein